MGAPRPTRDKAEGDREKVAPDAAAASHVSESREADVQDMPVSYTHLTLPTILRV